MKQADHKNLKSPWIGPDGNSLSLDEIREISKSWDQSTWTRYLDSLELPAKEKYLPEPRLRRESQKNNINIFDFSQVNSDQETRERVQDLLKSLTLRQRQVIEMSFWMNMSQRQIARSLSISQPAVLETRQQALKKLRDLLAENPITLPLVRGQDANERTKEEQDAQKNISDSKPEAI